jgi:two-component system NtrC family response regulator
MMILIIDDDAIVRSSLSLLLKRAGYETDTATSPDAALESLRRNPPDLMLMDMNFSLTTTGREGLELLQKVHILCPQVPVILITAWGSITLAVRGMKAGAFDFITKPWDNRQLLKSVETALELKTRNISHIRPKTRREADEQGHFPSIIGRSDALLEVLSTVARIAATNAPVLITGESGTGKELIAEAIHNNSPRKHHPFVKVNLGGMSQSLFESEMFGHRKGAFTGAHADRTGRFELADHGTIFLDEIGEPDITCQVKLLRVLQDQTFEPLGDSHTRKVDLRVVSATNADLTQMVRDRTFREDLFYRINLIHIHLPPLRDRQEDIPLLAQTFADRQSLQSRQPRTTFTPDALEYLRTQPFPGNIRELKNLVERTILVSGKEEISADDLRRHAPPAAKSPAALTAAGTLRPDMTLDNVQEQIIRNALNRHNGNLTQAARALGISRTALYRRIEKYGL